MLFALNHPRGGFLVENLLEPLFNMSGEHDFGLDTTAAVGQTEGLEELDSLLQGESKGLPGEPPIEDMEAPDYQAWVLADRLLLSSLPPKEVHKHFREFHEGFRALPGTTVEQRTWMDDFATSGENFLISLKGLRIPEGQFISNNPIIPRET